MKKNLRLLSDEELKIYRAKCGCEDCESEASILVNCNGSSRFVPCCLNIPEDLSLTSKTAEHLPDKQKMEKFYRESAAANRSFWDDEEES